MEIAWCFMNIKHYLFSCSNFILLLNVNYNV